MDKITREKIEKWHGWDFCDHNCIRNYCGICCYDVPTFIKLAEMPNLEFEGQLPIIFE